MLIKLIKNIKLLKTLLSGKKITVDGKSITTDIVHLYHDYEQEQFEFGAHENFVNGMYDDESW